MLIKCEYGFISVPKYGKPDLIVSCLSEYGEWGYVEALIASTLVESGDLVWDIGAHLGTFSLGLAMNAQLGKLLAVDANPEIIDNLDENLTRNLNCNFSKVLAGVSSLLGQGTVQLVDQENHGGAQFVFSNDNIPSSKNYTPSITLKNLRAQYGNYDFLKLDIEGMEFDALQGDEEYITDFKPVIWAECNENNQIFELFDYLIKLGYSPLYVAFPVIRGEKYKNKPQIVSPMAYEAALVCASPQRLNKLSTSAIKDPCIVRKVSTNNELRRALWDTPRWAYQEWVELSQPELVARIGHLERGDVFENFPEFSPATKEMPDITKERSSGGIRSPDGMLQVFWVATENEDNTAVFSERNAQSAAVPLDGTLQSLSFILPADQGPLRIRIDPLDRIGLITLKSIKLSAQLDATLWLWGRSACALHNMSGILEFPAGNGCTYICINNDPHFEILIPATVFTCGIEKMSIKIEIKVEALEQSLSKLIKPVTRKSGAHPPLTLSQDIASLTEQITQSLADRDQKIVNQHQQLHQLRNELLRTEAQLDLLKDLMLGGQNSERIRTYYPTATPSGTSPLCPASPGKPDLIPINHISPSARR